MAQLPRSRRLALLPPPRAAGQPPAAVSLAPAGGKPEPRELPSRQQRLQTWRPGASWLLSDSAQPGKGSPGLQDSPQRVPQGPSPQTRLRSQESDDRSQGSYRAFAAEPGAAPPPPPASCLHTRRRPPRGQQRRRREGGPGRELVMKTGQREGQALPRWPPACPPPWPLWLELGSAAAGPVSLQPRKLCPRHGGHPPCQSFLGALRLRPQPQPLPAAPGPTAGDLRSPAPGVHAGSLPGPTTAGAQTPSFASTDALVLAGHSRLQAKRALAGGSPFCPAGGGLHI
ncbi:basic proline-rich protein-like [Meles meles]|uniref:basic proline-rich protein-like n=1 Tax=Meles meles TaxID=9662 RepID=UPI001E69FE21|nr:basic proline-rich protein-like [Meles meles]